MKKRVLAVILVLVFAAVFAFADTDWWVGQKISTFNLNGLVSVSSSEVEEVLYKYKNQTADQNLISTIQKELTDIDGISAVSTGAKNSADGLVLVFEFTEYPIVGNISFEGYSKVKKSVIAEAVTSLVSGNYINLKTSKAPSQAVSEIQSLYAGKGFGIVPVEYTTEIVDNYVNFTFKITEGVQTRVTDIQFIGNTTQTNSELKKLISSSKKGLFSSGYYNEETVNSDISSISESYLSLGYIDATVEAEVVEDENQNNSDYNDVTLKFIINEGEQWTFGGMDITGNSIFSTEEINSLITSEVGEVVNFTRISSDYENIQNLYFNNGYITTPINVEEERDDENKIVSYHLTVTEGVQSFIERIEIEGLEKTKDYVMRRELSMTEGDIFSKDELITSLQNLYNTGLLSEVDYELAFGETENGIILTFVVTEGNHMNIQFGATFGGSVSGFPVSGFLQWSDTNLGGRGQELDVSTTISPDTQSASVTFGDSWFKNYRWSNSLSLEFSHTKYTDQLQKGVASPSYNTIDYDENTYPLGFDSRAQWIASGMVNPSSDCLMDYQTYTAGLSYDTGYTWIMNKGRLSLSGSLSLTINKAVYDTAKEMPYDKLIYKYGQKWCYSNSVSATFQWDGRDYVNNTTKGYVVSSTITYAGGALGGLSNYIKLSTSASGYKKLFEVGDEDNRKNIMFCATTTISAMLPQYYKNSDFNDEWAWYDASLGATTYEMLYIDGMTVARGFDAITGQAFLWDNMLEVSYPIKTDVINAEVFVSATGLKSNLKNLISGTDWYFAAGAGVKLKISGFPLGLYIVKNATFNDDGFSMVGGSILKLNDKETSGFKLVLAISTSLI